MVLTQEKGQSIKNISEEVQTLELLDEEFK